MREIELTIIHPTDPLAVKSGGAETFLNGFVKLAPKDFNIKFIGISTNYEKLPPKKWTKLNLGGKEFDFYPLCFVEDENHRTQIPISLRFTFLLKFSKIRFPDAVLFFNRIEPGIIFKKDKSAKLTIIHNDICEQLKRKSEYVWSKLPWLYYRFEKSVFGSLDCVYTVNTKTLEYYQSRYLNQKDKFHFIPTFVDTDTFCPVSESKSFLKDQLKSFNPSFRSNTKWILFVGRLQKQKAPIRLIESFYEYYRIDRSASLIIIGEGNLREDTEKRVKGLNIENNVFFIHRTDQKILATFYRASDVLLLTSNFEGMPMCVLESLGCGTPVVSTEVGEVKRAVQNGFSGEVIKNATPEEIADAMATVLSHPDIYTKENCISCILEYTPQKVLNPLYSMIRKLYKERHG